MSVELTGFGCNGVGNSVNAFGQLVEELFERIGKGGVGCCNQAHDEGLAGSKINSHYLVVAVRLGQTIHKRAKLEVEQELR